MLILMLSKAMFGFNSHVDMATSFCQLVQELPPYQQLVTKLTTLIPYPVLRSQTLTHSLRETNLVYVLL